MQDQGTLVMQWLSDVEEAQGKVESAKKQRNYYEYQRKKEQKKLDILMKKDPRQMRLEVE